MNQITTCKLSQIEFDDEIYPRSAPKPERIVDLRAAVDDGEKLPPIAVCHIRGRDRLYLVDGMHRRMLYIQMGLANVEIEDIGLLTKLEALEESIRRNNRGPLPIYARDREVAADKLRALGATDSEIESLLHITRSIIKDLKNRVYTTAEGHKRGVPIEMRNHYSGEQITRTPELRKVADSIPTNWRVKAAMKHLIALDGIDILGINDAEFDRLAKKLYLTLREKYGEKVLAS